MPTLNPREVAKSMQTGKAFNARTSHPQNRGAGGRTRVLPGGGAIGGYAGEVHAIGRHPGGAAPKNSGRSQHRTPGTTGGVQTAGRRKR